MLNTTMMGTVLVDAEAYTPDQVNEFFRNVFLDLHTKPDKISEFMQISKPSTTPQAYLWLV